MILEDRIRVFFLNSPLIVFEVYMRGAVVYFLVLREAGLLVGVNMLIFLMWQSLLMFELFDSFLLLVIIFVTTRSYWVKKATRFTIGAFIRARDLIGLKSMLVEQLICRM